MRKIALMIVFFLIFFSCEKDKQLIIENTDIPLISKVLIGGEIYKEYSYNSANLLNEEKSKFHYNKYIYNDRNQLITSDIYWDISIASSNSSVFEAAMNRKEWVNPDNTPKSISHTFEYNSKGQLIRKTYIRPTENYSDFVEFLYEDERIIRATGYYNDAISGYTDYIYDDNGNLIKQLRRYHPSSAEIAELSTTTEYEYDNMRNPYQSFKRLMTPGIYTNQNNIIKETYTIHFEVDPWIEKVQITENSYDYNDKGYPIKVNELTEYVYN
ncbi:hypothetical protein ES708_25129 [subsurface metagenome]